MAQVDTQKSVLVVDDEPRILRVVKVSLGLAGYDVVTTTSGVEALQLSRIRNFDVILLDLVMQPLSGFDVLAKLREFSQTPVIVFTAKSDFGARALKEGANGYISKPFMPEQLTKKIEDTLNSRKADA